LGGISLILLIPGTLLWLVNLDIAIRVQRPSWQAVERFMPVEAYQSLSVYCEDLSTISTLIPVLLLLFPLLLVIRVWRWGKEAPGRLLHEVYDPYPPHFPFFLVMLGLAGTLYGLLIGLDVSGVSTLGGNEISPDKIQQTLDQLLGGTATALLSSLLGLAGAFLAARPLTWISHRMVNMPGPTEALSLEETFHELIQDMQALGHASKEFREQLGLTEIPDVPKSLQEIQSELQALRETFANRTFETSIINLMDAMQQQQRDWATQQAAQGIALMEKLSAMNEHLAGQMSAQQEENQALRGLTEQLGNWTGQQTEAQVQAREQRSQMLDHLQKQRSDKDGDRIALRQAFGKFLDSSGEAKES
jgi:hypothetical protein